MFWQWWKIWKITERGNWLSNPHLSASDIGLSHIWKQSHEPMPTHCSLHTQNWISWKVDLPPIFLQKVYYKMRPAKCQLLCSVLDTLSKCEKTCMALNISLYKQHMATELSVILQITMRISFQIYIMIFTFCIGKWTTLYFTSTDVTIDMICQWLRLFLTIDIKRSLVKRHRHAWSIDHNIIYLWTPMN